MLGLRAAKDHDPVALAVDPLNSAEPASAAGASSLASDPTSEPTLPAPLAVARQRRRDVAALLEGGAGVVDGEEDGEEEEEEGALLDWRAKAF